MHPWFALWLFAATMARALVGGSVMPNTESTRPTETIAVSAIDYFQTEIVSEPLPDMLLDRLADLHWLESEPFMPV